MKNNLDKDLLLSRRSFLVASVNASIMMAFAPLILADNSESAAESLQNKQFAPTVWFEIDANGKVLVNIAKAEMGQHVGTALAKIIADELGANWDDVSIKHVDSDTKWGFMVTGGSWSVFTSFKMLSQAGAAGRISLLEAAAKLLNTTVEQCRIENSQVNDGTNSISFADIVKKGDISKTFTSEALDALPIKPANLRQEIGREVAALDIPAKTNGTAVYGIDVEIDGMIYARPIVPPTRYGCQVTGVDDSQAQKINGYLGFEILKDPSNTLQGWVSVLARDYHSAIKAGDAINVIYNKGAKAKTSFDDIQAHGRQLANDKNAGLLYIDDGDVEQALNDQQNRIITADYYTAPVLHFQMEPVNAVVELKQDTWHIHTGNQWQSLSLPLTAKALGVSEDKVIYHQYYLGGGFGRRLYGDYTVPAALTAKAINKPVKMVFTRADDARFDCIRSPSVQHFEAALDGSNRLTAMYHGLAAGWPTKSMAPGFLFDSLDKKGGIDGFSTNGSDHWYTVPNHRVRTINNSLAQETFLPGWLRAVGPGWIGWGVESFIDEIALASNTDPIQFRLALLDGKGKNAGKAPESIGGAKRLANTLKILDERLQKQYPDKISFADNEGIGIATTTGQERTMPTWIACAAAVKVNRQTGKIIVKKIHAVVDCGTVVHPDGALAQVESSILWGLSLALHESTSIDNGQVTDVNLNTYTPLRMADVPELDIHFIDSTEIPTGLGEPGLIAVGPAIANAIFDAIGIRLRSLPMKPKDITQALAMQQ